MHLTPLGGRALGSNLNIQLSGDRLDLLPKARAHTLGLRHPRVKSQYSILFLLGLSLPAPDHLRALLESLRSEGSAVFFMTIGRVHSLVANSLAEGEDIARRTRWSRRGRQVGFSRFSFNERALGSNLNIQLFGDRLDLLPKLSINFPALLESRDRRFDGRIFDRRGQPQP